LYFYQIEVILKRKMNIGIFIFFKDIFKGGAEMTLYNLNKEDRCTIVSLPDVGLLQSLGIRKGMNVNITNKQPLGGPVIVQKDKKILLMGNPNVGKSVIFYKLTGMEVEISNYAGTTVGFTKSKIKLEDDDEIDFIDVPGTYSLESTNEAEDIAVKFMESNPTAVVCVLDSSHLERNLKLALQIKRYNTPIIFVLNLLDVSKRQGIEI